jgi:ATP-dependent DNA helicase RecG
VSTFDTPLRKSAVQGDTAKVLESALGLRTVGDLLYHFPRRYAERGAATDLSALVVDEDITIMAKVQSVNFRTLGPKKSLTTVVVGDGRQPITLTFFNQPKVRHAMHAGQWGLFAGKATKFHRTWQLNSPEFQLFGADDAAADAVEEFAGGLVPLYPASAKVKLRSWTIGRAVRTLLDVVQMPDDPLPDEVRRRFQLVDLATALHDIHRPPTYAALDAARERLKWDEAFALQVTLAQRRHLAAADAAVARPSTKDGLLAAFDASLPFALTEGQRVVGATLEHELARSHPMHRLLQGEVGSGKTVCALRAMLQVVDSGGQAALLAPTEVLAGQHARSLRALLGPLGESGELGSAEIATRIALLTGSISTAARRTALREAADGTAGIVVGTHALIQEGVEFLDLGLVVVDEQHRFGVEQRDALRAKGNQPPHALVMTATPIPRTVAMTVYGDLETSVLRELPAGRSPITSHVVPAADKPHYLDRAWQRIREEVAAGHQAYVVCPRIGDATRDDEPEAMAEAEGGPADDGGQPRPPLAVLDVAPMLTDGPLHGLRIGILHGRLPADTKDTVMREFAAGRLDVVVATTVIEVGVDVPNATVMVILDADRFGVSQLHQLRGRIGRGTAPGVCLFVTDVRPGVPSRSRLDAVASTVDGFELAQLDLEQRREGDILGAMQSGSRSALKLLSLRDDGELISSARDEAARLVEADPGLDRHPALAAAVAGLVSADRADFLEKG